MPSIESRQDNLLRLKKSIEDGIAEKNRIEGKLEEYVKQLQTFGCKNIAQADARLESMQKELEELDAKLVELEREFTKKYPAVGR